MFKALLTAFLCLSLNASAQSVDASGCMDIGQIIFGIASEKVVGKPLKVQISEMHQALDNTENAELIPFFEQKIVEVYQSKKTAQEQGQDFINQCFTAHGDLSKLTGKKV